MLQGMTVTDEQLAFFAAHLPPPPARVLDAGCGRGELATTLQRLGYSVTAIDIDPPADAQPLVVRADVTHFHDDPFDAVLFSLSLHHVADLAEAARRARALTKPGGVLIIDEMAWERADRGTATWFYDMAAALEAHPVVVDPEGEWLHRHRDAHPMHTGQAMIDAISTSFDIVEQTAVPYLHRYLAGWGARRSSVAKIEEIRIQDDTLTAIGVRIVAG